MPPVLLSIDADSVNSSELFPARDKRATIPAAIHFTMDFKDFSIRRLLDYCLATNNEEAWNEFFEKIRPTAFGVVHKRVNRCGRHDPDLVQDLFQETMLKLVDKNKAALHNFEWFHEDSIYGYVKVVASRVVADHFRRLDNEVSLDAMPDIFSSSALIIQSTTGVVFQGTVYRVCGLGRAMPNAVVTFKNFWTDAVRVAAYENVTNTSSGTCKNN